MKRKEIEGFLGKIVRAGVPHFEENRLLDEPWMLHKTNDVKFCCYHFNFESYRNYYFGKKKRRFNEN